MVEKKEVYYCEECHNLVESLWNGKPNLVCCGKPMKKLEPNKTDAAVEKHVPVIERNGNKVTVKVGSVLHPMEEKHFIQFIELIADGRVYRKMLKPGEQPVYDFCEYLSDTGKSDFSGQLGMRVLYPDYGA